MNKKNLRFFALGFLTFLPIAGVAFSILYFANKKPDINTVQNTSPGNKEILLELDDANDKIRELQEKIEKKEIEIKTLSERIKKIQEEKEVLINKLEEKNKKINSIEDQIKALINEGSTSLISQEKIKQLESEKEKLSGQVVELNNEINDKDKIIGKLEKELENLTNTIKEIENLMNFPTSVFREYNYNEYTEKIQGIFLNDKSAEEIVREYKGQEDILLDRLNKEFNLSELTKGINLNIENLKINKWKLQNDNKIQLADDISNLSITYNDELNERKSISFEIEITDEKSEKFTKQFTIAFFIKQNNSSFAKWWDDYKEKSAVNNAIVLNNENYDHALNLINSNDSRKAMDYIFNSQAFKEKAGIPNFAKITHKIYKIESDGNKELVDKILKNVDIRNIKYTIEFSYQIRDNLVEYNDSWELELEFNGEYSRVLFNRIDKLNNEIKDVDFLVIKRQIEYNWISIFLHDSLYMSDNKTNSFSEYENSVKYLLEGYSKEQFLEIMKNPEYIGPGGTGTIINDNNKYEYISSQDFHRGLLNSAIGKDYDFSLFEKSAFDDKLEIVIKTNDSWNTGESNIIDDEHYYLKNDNLRTISVTFKFGNETKSISFAFTDPGENNDIYYNILSDATRGVDTKKVSYNAKSNLLTIETNREKYNRYLEATKKVLSDYTNVFYSQELVNALNDALENNNGIQNLHKYGMTGQNVQFYNKEKVRKYMEEIVNQSEKNKESKQYSSLVAGGITNINDFGFGILWNITD